MDLPILSQKKAKIKNKCSLWYNQCMVGLGINPSSVIDVRFNSNKINLVFILIYFNIIMILKLISGFELFFNLMYLHYNNF